MRDAAQRAMNRIRNAADLNVATEITAEECRAITRGANDADEGAASWMRRADDANEARRAAESRLAEVERERDEWQRNANAAPSVLGEGTDAREQDNPGSYSMRDATGIVVARPETLPPGEPCETCGVIWMPLPRAAPGAGDAGLREALASLVEWATGRDIHGRNEKPDACGYCAALARARRALSAPPSAPADSGEKIREALAFAASVIKSGEPWTSECERIIGGALSPSTSTDAAKGVGK